MDNNSVITNTLLTFLFAAIPMAVLVTKGVDLIRNLFDPKVKAPSWTWNIVAFGIGAGMCIGWQVNPVGSLAHAIPALANGTRFNGVAGQVLSGLAVGAMGGLWHEKLSAWSAISGPANPER